MTRRATVAFACAVVALLSCGAAPARGADTSDPLATLRKGHPRLMALDADIARVKQAIASEPLAKQWHDHLRADADRQLGAAPVEHKLVGPRLLGESRKAVGRISLWAGLYRLDGDRKYADRAIKEMLTAAAFPDWNPRHFLDTAEMTNALGIGYDWLYDVMTPQDRATIRRAIVELGLKEGMKVYTTGGWWSKATHNWNQVCNGGMTVGALAIADEEPDLARQILNAARKSIPRAMASFAPDGGWNEGPGYWGYTNQYTAFFLAATENALGTDFGIKQSPGYADTGYFRMHFISPIGMTFNYADAGERAGDSYAMMYMARTLDRPLYAAHERNSPRGASILHLLWWDGRETWPKQDFPTAGLWTGVDVALMRSSWTDRSAFWVGFKGGDNKANHSHLDLGTFNFDALGERWALDLGGDDYNLPGYFGKQRWTYYRLRTEGHNTLTIDDDNQDPKAAAPMIAFASTPAKTFAVADVTAAYGAKLSSWRRGIALLDGKRVAVVDEIAAKGAPVKVTWNMHTAAKIEPSGSTALLTQGKAKLKATILAPEGAKFVVKPANPGPPQRDNKGVNNLAIDLPGVTRTALRVIITAADDAEPKTLGPLDQWVTAGKIQKK